LFLSKSHESQYHAAIHKGSSLQTLNSLHRVADVKQRKQYRKTWYCNSVLLQNQTILQGSLCRKRWCQHCNRIKTAELIKGYHEPLSDMQKDDSLYFVTLTAPTVSGRKLRSEIRKRYKAFSRIKDNLRKNYAINLNGIRKLEITYTLDAKFHPHFHLIIQGKSSAITLQRLWLDQFPSADLKGQDIRLIDSSEPRNLLEVFKYSVKPEVKDATHAKAYNHIYKCLEGVRTIQTFGTIRKVKEPKEAKTERLSCDWIEPRFEIWSYNEHTSDYTNAYNETLIGTQDINKRLSERINS